MNSADAGSPGPAVSTLAVAGYRSLRDLRLSLGRLTVVTGGNGSGKSSLYRALRLLAAIPQGGLVRALALEGGLPSVLWAGPERFSRGMRDGTVPVRGTVRSEPVSLRMGFSSAESGYAIDLGLPTPPTRFNRDPEIKAEALWTGPVWRRATLFAERHRPFVQIRDRDGAWTQAAGDLRPEETMLREAADRDAGLELLRLRQDLAGWRFYDQFRTDADAPARRDAVGTRTPVLAADGADLAAAIATIEELGDAAALAATVDDAFAGATLRVRMHDDGRFALEMRQPGLLRPLGVAELSDGTLRYVLLLAALLTPRPPRLMVFNEPEASLHPALLAPLARLIVHAAEASQILVVSHAPDLATALIEAGAETIVLAKELGETVAVAAGPPHWVWPRR